MKLYRGEARRGEKPGGSDWRWSARERERERISAADRRTRFSEGSTEEWETRGRRSTWISLGIRLVRDWSILVITSSALAPNPGGWLLRFPLPLLIAARHSPFCTTRIFHPRPTLLFASFIKFSLLHLRVPLDLSIGNEREAFQLARSDLTANSRQNDRWPDGRVASIQVYRGCGTVDRCCNASSPRGEERLGFGMSQADGIRVIHLLGEPLDLISARFLRFCPDRNKLINDDWMYIYIYMYIGHQGYLANDDRTELPLALIQLLRSKLSIRLSLRSGQESRWMMGRSLEKRRTNLGGHRYSKDKDLSRRGDDREAEGRYPGGSDRIYERSSTGVAVEV